MVSAEPSPHTCALIPRCWERCNRSSSTSRVLSGELLSTKTISEIALDRPVNRSRPDKKVSILSAPLYTETITDTFAVAVCRKSTTSEFSIGACVNLSFALASIAAFHHRFQGRVEPMPWPLHRICCALEFPELPPISHDRIGLRAALPLSNMSRKAIHFREPIRPRLTICNNGFGHRRTHSWIGSGALYQLRTLTSDLHHPWWLHQLVELVLLTWKFGQLLRHQQPGQ